MMRFVVNLLIHKLLVLLRRENVFQFLVRLLHILQSFCAGIADLALARKLEMHAV